MREIVIRSSKSKMFFLFFGMAVFVVAGIWLVKMGLSPGERSGMFKIVTGAISIIFFGGGGVLLAFRYLSGGGPSLVINERGFVDRSSGVPVGFISWDDVAGISETRIGNNFFVEVAIRPDAEISTNPKLRPKALAINQKSGYGNVVTVSAATLDASHQYIYLKLDEYWRTYGRGYATLASPGGA